jgi:hypothetical protein
MPSTLARRFVMFVPASVNRVGLTAVGDWLSTAATITIVAALARLRWRLLAGGLLLLALAIGVHMVEQRRVRSRAA